MDPGSSLFFKLVKSVPLLAPKHQAMVSKAARDTSVANMIGTPQDTDAWEAEKLRWEQDEGGSDDEPEAGSAESNIVTACYKKRKIYKQTSESLVPWFPPR